MVAKVAAIEPAGRIGRLGFGARRILFGRVLSTAEEMTERLPKWKALAVFSSDNLSSVAYATELTMFALIAAGTGALWLTMPISVLIVTVLGIIVVSYRQTIRAYPSGGGSYVVAKENLGQLPGLVAAAALLTDYVLTVSVSVAAGVAAIVSAFPGPLADQRVLLSAIAILMVMAINLRGIRESGSIFAAPTYVFLVSTLGLIALGVAQTLLGDPPRVTGITPVTVPVESLGLLLLMRAFADGCSAITGVEAVSNGVQAFKPPESNNARTTLTVVGVLVAVMFLGISYLAGVSGALPTEHETVMSQIGRAVYGTGPSYYVLQLATTGILILAANTSFADFPRLSSLLARDSFMPRQFAFRGERLAFNTGIVSLALLAILVLAAFGGRVEALIPLYAIGVFTSITLSQAGMVRHWLREGGANWRRSAAINGTGAVATGLVTIIFAVAKFALGAWIIVVIVPLLVLIMLFVHREYATAQSELHVRPEAVIGPPRRRQRVVVPIQDMRRDVIQAIKFGLTMSPDVVAVHVTDDLAAAESFRERFERQVPGVELVIVESPFRELVRPLIRYLEVTTERDPTTVTIVLLPERIIRHWWERFLYNQNAHRIRAALTGHSGILVADVPFRRAA